MNEDVKSTSVHIHSRADELIACLEGEIAKRDARIVELESRYQRDVYGLNNEGDPIGGDPAGGYANDNARLRAELFALKAPDTVGEVVGWYRLDRPYEMTSYPSVCATWHKLGAPVAPLYAAPAAPAADAVLTASEWTKDADEWGGALNYAAWEFINECPEKSALLFNNTKGPLRAAIMKYAELVAASAKEPSHD